MIAVFREEAVHLTGAERTGALRACLDGAHAARSEETRRDASHSYVTPGMPFASLARMTFGQCSGAMLFRSRILRAASYPQPTSAANSVSFFQLEIRSVIVLGVFMALCRTIRTNSMQAIFVHLGRHFWAKMYE